MFRVAWVALLWGSFWLGWWLDAYCCVNSVVYASYLPQFSVLGACCDVWVDCEYSGLWFGIVVGCADLFWVVILSLILSCYCAICGCLILGLVVVLLNLFGFGYCGTGCGWLVAGGD